MNQIDYSFASLHEFALPTKGAFKDHIGSVKFGDYETLVMTQTADLQINGNAYKTIKGYVLVKPLADQFKKSHPDSKIRRVSNWGQGKRSVLNSSTEIPVSISIEGSKEVQGTYFRHDIVLDVLEWLCPDFKQEIKAVYENHVVQNNANRQAESLAEKYNSGITIEDLLRHEGVAIEESV
jgi:hypothetical protein